MWKRTWGLWLGQAIMAACSAGAATQGGAGTATTEYQPANTTPPPPDPRADPSDRFMAPVAQQLANARWPPPPPPPSNADGRQRRDYIAHAWMPWLDERQQRVQATHDAVLRLLQGQASAFDRQRAWWELLALWSALESDAVTAARNVSEPQRQQLESLLRLGYQRRKVPRRADLVSACLQATSAGRSLYGEACAREFTALQQAAAAEEARRAEARRKHEERLRRSATVPGDRRPPKATRQVHPCEFAGSLEMSGLEMSGTFQSSARDAFYATAEVEAARVEPPVEEGAPIRIALEWPVIGDFTLAPSNEIFVLDQRLTFVEGHLWTSKGASVQATRLGPGKVRARKQLPGAFQPNTAALEVPCGSLRLKQAAPAAPSNTSGDWVELSSGAIPLYASPGTSPVGSIDGGYFAMHGVQVTRSEAAWVQISASGALNVRGWIENAHVDPMAQLEMVTLGGVQNEGQTAEVLTESIPVRLEASLAAPAIGSLPPGQRLYRWSNAGTFVGLKVVGAIPANSTGEFFVVKNELEAALTKR